MWNKILDFIRSFGILGLLIAAATTSIIWATTIDARLEMMEQNSNENKEDIRKIGDSIAGPSGLNTKVNELSYGIKAINTTNRDLRCSISLGNSQLWFTNFERELWARPIDELSKPNSRMNASLSQHIRDWEALLELCNSGRIHLNQLRRLKKGLWEYYIGDYEDAYEEFSFLENQRSLTHRLMGAAALKRVDQYEEEEWVNRLRLHANDVLILAQAEINSHSKSTVIPLMICQSLLYGGDNHVLEAAKCYEIQARKGVKTAFSYAASASAYAALDKFNSAMKMLIEYDRQEIKEIGQKALRDDKHLRKLLDTEHAKDFIKILGEGN